MTLKKNNFWNTPYPVTIMNAFKTLLPQNGEEKKTRSPRGVRRLLVVCALVSLILIWVIDGFSNPFEYLVDLPSLTYEEIVNAFPGYEAYYYMWLMIITAVMVKILKQLVCSDKDFSVWSVNGALFWVVSLAVAILAGAVTRSIVMPRFVLPMVEKASNASSDIGVLILSVLVTHFAFYFAVEDFSSSAVAVIAAPYAIRFFNTYIPAEGLLDIQLVQFLVLTFLLKLLVTVLDKLGVTGFLSDLLTRYLYTPKYMPFSGLALFAIPFLPFMYIRYLIRKGKEQKDAPEQ